MKSSASAEKSFLTQLFDTDPFHMVDSRYINSLSFLKVLSEFSEKQLFLCGLFFFSFFLGFLNSTESPAG